MQPLSVQSQAIRSKTRGQRGSLEKHLPLVLFILSLIILVAVPIIYGREYPKSIASVFDDVVTLGRFSCFVGFLSDLGIVLWFAMSILFMHGYHRRIQSDSPPSFHEAGFYLLFGGLTFWLGLDDRLLIHEWLSENYQVPEALLVLVYGVIVLIGGWRYRAYLAAPGAVAWLWVAFPCFVASVAIDLGFFDPSLANLLGASMHEVAEESLKWIGICSLFLYVFVLMTHLPNIRRKSA